MLKLTTVCLKRYHQDALTGYPVRQPYYIVIGVHIKKKETETQGKGPSPDTGYFEQSQDLGDSSLC